VTNFFTGDEHYGDKGIIHYCNRGYSSPESMNKDIIHRNNSVVKPGDTVYHLGDLTFNNDLNLIRDILKQLYGTHILILGNHDRIHPFELVEAGFQSVHTALTLNIQGFTIILAHDPSIWTVVPQGTIFICGHIHCLFKSIPDKLVYNAGVDVNNLYPVSFEQILRELNLKEIKK